MKIKILGSRVLISKLEEETTDGFQTVSAQDNFIYKGKVEQNGDSTTFPIGSTVLFAKYSPDTHEIEVDNQKMKIININDILAIYE